MYMRFLQRDKTLSKCCSIKMPWNQQLIIETALLQSSDNGDSLSYCHHCLFYAFIVLHMLVEQVQSFAATVVFVVNQRRQSVVRENTSPISQNWTKSCITHSKFIVVKVIVLICINEDDIKSLTAVFCTVAHPVNGISVTQCDRLSYFFLTRIENLFRSIGCSFVRFKRVYLASITC